MEQEEQVFVHDMQCCPCKTITSFYPFVLSDLVFTTVFTLHGERVERAIQVADIKEITRIESDKSDLWIEHKNKCMFLAV